VDLNELSAAVISGNLAQATELTRAALDGNVPVETVLNDGLIAGMTVVGEKFKNNEFYVPEVLIAARAMNGAMKLIEPELVKEGIEPVGTVVLATVKGDLHDIGKNLVGMMLKGGGFNVVDLTVDCPPAKFIEAAIEHDAQIVAMSALLTTTMVGMKDVVDAIKMSPLDGKVRTMVGGAPVTQSYCDEIGADGYAPDAASAVDVARELVSVH